MPPIEKNYPGREPLPLALCLNRTAFCPFCLPQRGPHTLLYPTLAGPRLAVSLYWSQPVESPPPPGSLLARECVH
jgi:hypothetical protein